MAFTEQQWKAVDGALNLFGRFVSAVEQIAINLEKTARLQSEATDKALEQMSKAYEAMNPPRQTTQSFICSHLDCVEAPLNGKNRCAIHDKED